MTEVAGAPEDTPPSCVLCGALVSAGDLRHDAPCRECGFRVRRCAALFARLRADLSRTLGVDAARITSDTTLDELGADSLDVIEYVMEIEDDFDVPDPSSIRTIGDAIRQIERGG